MKNLAELEAIRRDAEELRKRCVALFEDDLKEINAGDIVPEDQIDPEIYRRGYHIGDACPTGDGGILEFGGIGGNGGYTIYIKCVCDVCHRDFAYYRSIY